MKWELIAVLFPVLRELRAPTHSLLSDHQRRTDAQVLHGVVAGLRGPPIFATPPVAVPAVVTPAVVIPTVNSDPHPLIVWDCCRCGHAQMLYMTVCSTDSCAHARCQDCEQRAIVD